MTDQPPPLLVTISGPSGVGKNALMDALVQGDPGLVRVVTSTSRPPRPGEVHGVDYFFFSKDEFEKLIADGAFAEHAIVHDDYKGVLKNELARILGEGHDALLQVDVQGAATIRQLVPQALTIFVKPESLEALLQRQKERGDLTYAELRIRRRDAEGELAREGEFDYVVVNRTGDLSDSVEEVARIIREERLRPGREAPMLPP